MNPATAQRPVPVRTFAHQLSPTRHGARLARLLAGIQLRAWPLPPAVVEQAELIAAELAANAALHGCPDDRDFRLGLTLDPARRVLRVEATDTHADVFPTLLAGPVPDDGESGRGLLIATTLADRWGVDLTTPPHKTVWAELDLLCP